MTKYYFNDDLDFEIQLKQIDNSVPSLLKGRKTEHVERYSIVNFLKTFIDFENLSLPFTLIHRDRPDFLIINSKMDIGIEFTESVPEQLKRAKFLCKKQFPNGLWEPSIFGWDAPKRNNSEILEILRQSQEKLIGQGSTGYSIEKLWVKGILGCISNKIIKLNSKGFEEYSHNWLLIYDDQQRTAMDKNYVVEKLLKDLKEFVFIGDKIKFENIFIELPNNYFVIKLVPLIGISILSKKMTNP